MLMEMILSTGREGIITGARVLKGCDKKERDPAEKNLLWAQSERESRCPRRRDFRFGRENRRHLLSNGFYFLNKL